MTGCGSRGERALGSALAVILAVLVTCAGQPARAQMDSREGIALQNQILELRRDVSALRDQIARGGPGAGPGAAGSSFLGGGPGRPVPLTPPGVPQGTPQGGGGGGDLTAQLLSRVIALEEQVRALRGRTDELANQVQAQGQELPKQIGDLGFRLQQLEGGRAASPSAAQPPPPVGAGSGVTAGVATTATGSPPPRRPEVALQDGNAALARRDYASAEAIARDVLQNNRTSPRAYDAQFLLAQSLAGRQNWPQAAIAYDDAYSRSRTGSRAQDSLIGLSNALMGLGDKRAGCAALVKLRSEFPTIRADLREQVAATSKRGGC